MKRKENNLAKKGFKEINKIVDFYCEDSSAPIFFSDEKIINYWKNSNDKNNFFLAKDNFWTKDLPTTASSLFLSSFFPVDDATAIKLLKDKGYKLLGKTTLDEFACGGTGLFSSKGVITNPYNSLNLVGGSSSGSAYAVSKEIVPFALGHDTGDSVRRPASYCGIIGFKPSYGLISRYGVIPMASSFDTVGIMSIDIKIIREVFKIIAKRDHRDLVTFASRKEKLKNQFSKKKKIAIIKGIDNYLGKEFADIYRNKIELLKSENYLIEEIKIPEKITEHIQICYLILCSSELVSHLNSLQGVTYGQKDLNETVEDKRTQLIGKWVKERILLGNYFLEEENFILKAKELRFLVKKWSKKIFSEFDFLIFPGTNSHAPTIESFFNIDYMSSSHWSDNLLLLANFSGNPSINIPIGLVNGLPVSLNIDSNLNNDKNLLEFAEFILKK